MKSVFTPRRIAFGAILLGSALALSATDDPQRTLVSYYDLDLSTEQGAKVLYTRIDRAADRVCAPWDGRELAHKRNFELCHRAAVDRAVADVDRATLTALHQARTQKTRVS